MKYDVRSSRKTTRSSAIQLVGVLILALLGACSQTDPAAVNRPLIQPADIVFLQDDGDRSTLQEQTISGTIEVEISKQGDIVEVEYFIDGTPEAEGEQPVARSDLAPFTVMIDTSGLTNGRHTLLLRAKHSVGNSAVSEVTVPFNVDNDPQGECRLEVNVGANLEISLSTGAVISASVSDAGCPEGELTVRWDSVEGPATPTFSKPDAVSTQVSFPLPGDYVLRLVATVGEVSAERTVKVKVTTTASDNSAPSVDAGPDLEAFVYEWKALHGVASDDGMPFGRLALAWAKVSGPGNVQFSAPEEATTKARFTAPGTYVISLSASDDELSATDLVTVTVAPAPAAEEPTPPPATPVEPPPTTPVEPEPSPSVRTGTELLGDPGFDVATLPTNTRTWYNRFLTALDNPNQDPDIPRAAAKGDLYQLGRYVATNITTTLTIFRLTGDLNLLDHVDHTMQIAREQLKDTNGDGYPNWRWLFDPNDRDWYGDDQHVMDEIMTHGMIAEVAWTYHQNRNLPSPTGINYQERADFWTNYLQQWEAKWRQRTKTPTGFPFIYKNLTHPYLNLIRYLWYTYRLTNDTAYLNEATRLANNFNKYELRQITTPNGPGLVFPHGITKEEPNLDYLAPLPYSEYSTQVLMDLSLEPFTPFTPQTTLTPLANTIATKVIDNGSTDFAPYIGGTNPIGGLKAPTNEPRTPATRWAIYPLAEYSAYDPTNTITNTNQQVYTTLERNPDKPTRIAIPAAMIIKDLINNPLSTRASEPRGN